MMQVLTATNTVIPRGSSGNRPVDNVVNPAGDTFVPRTTGFTDSVFHATGLMLMGSGLSIGGQTALNLAQALPAQYRTAAILAGAAAGLAGGVAASRTAGLAFHRAVADPSLKHGLKAGAWLGLGLSALGSAAALVGGGPAQVGLKELAIFAAGTTAAGTAIGGGVYGFLAPRSAQDHG